MVPLNNFNQRFLYNQDLLGVKKVTATPNIQYFNHDLLDPKHSISSQNRMLVSFQKEMNSFPHNNHKLFEY